MVVIAAVSKVSDIQSGSDGKHYFGFFYTFCRSDFRFIQRMASSTSEVSYSQH